MTDKHSAEYAWLTRHPFPVVERAFTETLGVALRKLREDLRHSRARAAQLRDDRISASMIVNFEIARTRVTITQLLDYCIGMNVTMPGFLEHVLANTRDVLGETIASPYRAAEAARAEEAEAMAALNKAATADTRTRVQPAETFALAEIGMLRAEVAKLRERMADLGTRLDEATKRAEAAEALTARLRESLADTAKTHQRELDKMRRDHEDELVEQRRTYREQLTRIRTKDLANLEQVTRHRTARVEQVAAERLARGLPGRPAATLRPDPREHVDAIGALIAAAVTALREDVDPRITPLTKRQIRIMCAAARGLESDAIATTVDTSRKTVDNELTAIYARLGVGNRGTALAVLFAGGWLDANEIGPTLFDDSDQPVDGEALRTRLRRLARRPDRDRSVAMLMALGHENPIIADKLDMSRSAVQNSVKLIGFSLGAKNRFHSVAILHYLAAVVEAEQQYGNAEPD